MRRFARMTVAVGLALVVVATAAPQMVEGQRARQGLLSLADARLFYEVVGTGAPIIVVHGGPGLDHAYLRTIADVYQDGPVGVETIAATLAEDTGTLEDVVEPYLLQIGFLARTRQGRRLTEAARDHLGAVPQPGPLFEGAARGTGADRGTGRAP